MTRADWIVLIAAVLPYVVVGFAKFRPDYDNTAPRVQLPGAPGWRGRVYAAHLNAFEAFAPFAAGVILAEQHHASQALVDALASVFLAARVAHPVCYARNWAALRSTIWVLGFLCVVGLFISAA